MEVLRPVLRGAKGPHKDIEVPLDAVGIYKLHFSSSIPKHEMTHRTKDGEEYIFKVNQSLKNDSNYTYPSGSIQVFALRDFDKIAADDHLALGIGLAKAPLEKDKQIAATVTLSSKNDTKPVYLEENLAQYAWYAVLDEKGTPVKWGSWHSVSDEPVAACKARKLAQSSIQWKLKIPANELKPGIYSVVASYKAELYLPQGIPLPDSEKCMLWGDLTDELKEAKPDTYIRYESGELGAKAAQPFTIPAKEESEAKKP